MIKLLLTMEAIVYALAAFTFARGLWTGAAGDLMFAGLMTPLLLAISWRFRAAGLLTRDRFDDRPF